MDVVRDVWLRWHRFWDEVFFWVVEKIHGQWKANALRRGVWLERVVTEERLRRKAC